MKTIYGKRISKFDIHLLTGINTGKNLVKANRLKARISREFKEIRNEILMHNLRNSSSFEENTTLLHNDNSFTNVSQDTGGLLLGFYNLNKFRRNNRKIWNIIDSRRFIHGSMKNNLINIRVIFN